MADPYANLAGFDWNAISKMDLNNIGVTPGAVAPVLDTGMAYQPWIQPAPSVDSSQETYWRDRNAREAQAAKDAADARAQAESRRVNNALASAKTFFEVYGMSELWGGVDALVRQGYNDADTISQVLSRDNTYQVAYFRRFPAVQRIREVNKQRLADGLTIMAEPSPASYVALEEGYRQALVGLPTGLWGSSQEPSHHGEELHKLFSQHDYQVSTSPDLWDD